MKIIISILISALLGVAMVSAATGSVEKNCTTGGIPCPGGATRAFNYTTAQFELLPQCFPWIWASDYFVMNIAEMYNNQNACRAQRAIDFRM